MPTSSPSRPSSSLPRTGARRSRSLGTALLVGLVLTALQGPAGSAAAAPAPAMHFDANMTIQAVCFPVTNPAGGTSVLYGERFTDGKVDATTPAIVLVHGLASSTETWDFSPTWSTARALAAKGYVVYAYDRLGYANSSYFDVPGGGYTLTTEAHRAMLHQVIGEVKAATYGEPASGTCSGPQAPGTLASNRVVIVGHSAGGWIVAGYPGLYHDVAAMIQADITGAVPPSASTSSGGSFTPDPAHPDYFQFFQTSQDCQAFDIYAPGAVSYVVPIACTPPFLDSPYGEIADIAAKYATNDASIALIGPSIPVLLTSGDHDVVVPASAAAADYAYYRANCGCDVSQIILPETGHLYQAHTSLAAWVDDVASWLAAHGIGPRT